MMHTEGLGDAYKSCASTAAESQRLTEGLDFLRKADFMGAGGVAPSLSRKRMEPQVRSAPCRAVVKRKPFGQVGLQSQVDALQIPSCLAQESHLGTTGCLEVVET
jgi:hypothetical protein